AERDERAAAGAGAVALGQAGARRAGARAGTGAGHRVRNAVALHAVVTRAALRVHRARARRSAGEIAVALRGRCARAIAVAHAAARVGRAIRPAQRADVAALERPAPRAGRALALRSGRRAHRGRLRHADAVDADAL